MGKLWFWTFGEGGNYADSVARLMRQALDSELFDECLSFDGDDLRRDAGFWPFHGDFIEAHPRGFGYWVWKSWLAMQMFNRMEEGDVMLYLDAGCEINLTALPRLQDYVARVEEKDSLFFEMSMACKERLWSKRDTIEFIGVDGNDVETPQVAGGVWLLKKTPKNVAIINEWFDVLTMDGYHHADDTPSRLSPLKGFKEHRHDQSVLSLLVKKHRLERCDDKLWYKNWLSGKSMPLLACRTRGGRSKLPWRNVKPLFRVNRPVEGDGNAVGGR